MTSAQVVFITTKIAFTFTSLSAVRIYDFHMFTVVYSPLHGFIWNQHNDQFPSWLDSSVGRTLHRYCRGHGFKSRTRLNFFFRPYFHYCSSSVLHCEDRFHIHVFICSSNILLSYIHSRLKIVMLRTRSKTGLRFLFPQAWNSRSLYSQQLLVRVAHALLCMSRELR